MALDIEVLKNVPIFQLLDDEELKELTVHIEEKSYSAGQYVFKAGEPGGEMHILLAGKVQTFITDEDGRRVVLDELEPGEWFGELSLLDSEPRSASAVVLNSTQTCVVNREDLQRLFTKKPDAALDVLTVLSRRLRKTDVLIAQRAARNTNVVIEEKLTFGDRIADGVARFGGSWMFINTFMVLMIGWMVLNTWTLFMPQPFDPAPFIGLNLVLSMLAALQAPVIMMSQNRQDAKDRVRADIEYEVNVRAEIGIHDLQQQVERMKDDLLEAILREKARA